MGSQLDARVAKFLAFYSSFSSVLSIGFGLLVLTGWAFHIEGFKTFLPHQVAVKANTGFCFVVIGLALRLIRDKRDHVWSRKLAAQGLAAFASIVGLLSFLEYWHGWNLGIDQLLFVASKEDALGSVRPGLMSPITALGFLFLGASLVLLDSKTPQGHWLAQSLAVATAVVCTFGILDFVLDYNTGHTYIALPTAILLFLLSFALICARINVGLGRLLASSSMGATMTRRLLPAAIIVPMVIGWLRTQGQAIGLYSEWAGIAIMIVSAVTLLAGIIVWTAFVIDRTDSEKQEAQESARRLASIVTSSNEAMIGKTLDGIVTSWNPAAEAIYGYSAEEMIGHSLTMAVPPDRLDEFQSISQKVARGEQVRHFETLRRRKDGQTFHVSLSVSPIKDHTGKIEGLSTVARDITEHKLAEERTERVNSALRALSECTERLMRANDEPTVLQQVCDVMVQIAGYRMAWVGYAEHDENKSVRPMAAAGFEEGYLRTADITWADVERGYGPTGTSIRTGTAVVCDDVVSDPQLAPWREHALRQGFRSSIAVPLKIGTDVMGTLTIYAVEPRRFQTEEKQLLEQLASNMTYAIMTLRARAERKKAEEELRQSSRYARSLIEASLDPLVTISKDGKIMDVNRATEEVTGVAREKLVGSDFSNYFTEPETAQQGYQQVYDKGFVQDYALAIRHASGRVTDVLYNATVFKNEAGEIQGVFAAARDITRRKQAEQKARQASQYARSLIEASLDPLVTISKNGKIMDVNRATEEVTGVGREKLVGSDFSNYFTEPEKAQHGYQQVYDKGFVQDYALAIRHASGRVTDVLYNATVFKNEAGEVQGVFAAARDITKRKQAEDEVRKLNRELEDRVQRRTTELRDSEERVRRKLESILSPEGDLRQLELADVLDIAAVQSLAEDFYKLARIPMFILDRKGHPLVAAGWQEICTKFHRAHPETCKNCMESDLVLSEGVETGKFKVYKCKNNMWDVVTPIVVGGQHVGNLFSGQFFFADETTDVSAFRSQANQYGFPERDYMAALENVPRLSREEVAAGMAFFVKFAQVLSQLGYSGIKLARSLEEIRRVNAELAASIKDLEAFTYSVSHDLRAPLRHISGFSKILAEEFASSLPPDAQHHLQRIEDGTRRMGQLVDDLLNLARVGRRDLNPQVAGLKSVVDEVIVDLKADSQGREIEWRIGALPFVECDPGLMKQVFQNLLSNALKFTRPRERPVIEVGQEDKNGVPVIYVRDNGVGFSMKYVDKLFGVFQRLHRAEDFEGTGVGLATVQRIIQKHGGRIWAEGELDKGAAFYFTLGGSEKDTLQANAAAVGEKS